MNFSVFSALSFNLQSGPDWMMGVYPTSSRLSCAKRPWTPTLMSFFSISSAKRLWRIFWTFTVKQCSSSVQKQYLLCVHNVDEILAQSRPCVDTRFGRALHECDFLQVLDREQQSKRKRHVNESLKQNEINTLNSNAHQIGFFWDRVPRFSELGTRLLFHKAPELATRRFDKANQFLEVHSVLRNLKRKMLDAAWLINVPCLCS